MNLKVEGRPAPKGSRMWAKARTNGKIYTYPASKGEASWIKRVAAETAELMRHQEMLEPPYAVELTFAMPRPARKNAKRCKPWPAAVGGTGGGADVDKLARAVLDGLVKGGAMEDDRHVIMLTAIKRWADVDEEPGVYANVETTVPLGVPLAA